MLATGRKPGESHVAEDVVPVAVDDPVMTAAPPAAMPAKTGLTAPPDLPPSTPGPPARARARRGGLGGPKGGPLPGVPEPLLKTLRANHPKADTRIVQRAYE